MSKSIEYSPDKDYILLRCNERATPDIAVASMGEMLELSTDHSCSKFLVDFRESTFVAPTIDTFELPSRFAKLGFSRHHKLAIVYARDEDDHKFMETVSRNLGLSVQVFSEFEAAEGWLK